MFLNEPMGTLDCARALSGCEWNRETRFQGALPAFQAVAIGPSATNLTLLFRLVILVSRVSAILRTVPRQWPIENFPNLPSLT